jgi:hypothetical protein
VSRLHAVRQGDHLAEPPQRRGVAVDLDGTLLDASHLAGDNGCDHVEWRSRQ